MLLSSGFSLSQLPGRGVVRTGAAIFRVRVPQTLVNLHTVGQYKRVNIPLTAEKGGFQHGAAVGNGVLYLHRSVRFFDIGPLCS